MSQGWPGNYREVRVLVALLRREACLGRELIAVTRWYFVSHCWKLVRLLLGQGWRGEDVVGREAASVVAG